MVLTEASRQLLTLYLNIKRTTTLVVAITLFAATNVLATTAVVEQNDLNIKKNLLTYEAVSELQILEESSQPTLIDNNFSLPHKISIDSPKVDSNSASKKIADKNFSLTTNDIHPITNPINYFDWRTIFTGISVLVAILALIVNLTVISSHKKRDIRKSLYDDLLFREIFYQPFNKELNKFIQTWGHEDTTNELSIESYTKFIDDLGRLQDTSYLISLISDEASEKLMQHLDKLTGLVSTDSKAENEARKALLDIYKLFIELMETMIKNDFKKKNDKK